MKLFHMRRPRGIGLYQSVDLIYKGDYQTDQQGMERKPIEESEIEERHE